MGNFALQNAARVYRLTAIGNDAGSEVVETRELSKSNPTSIYKVSRANHYDIYITKGQEIAFYSKKIILLNVKDVQWTVRIYSHSHFL